MNDKIKVFDNVFSRKFQDDMYVYAKNSYFQLGITDSEEYIESPSHISSSYSREDIDRIGFLDRLRESEVGKHIENYEFFKATVNLSKPVDIHYPHTHPNDLVALYYINTAWKVDWGGETLFFRDDFKEILYASIYTPNRVILFEPDIPHMLKPHTIHAPNLRMTIAVFFNRK